MSYQSRVSLKYDVASGSYAKDTRLESRSDALYLDPAGCLATTPSGPVSLLPVSQQPATACRRQLCAVLGPLLLVDALSFSSAGDPQVDHKFSTLKVPLTKILRDPNHLPLLRSAARRAAHARCSLSQPEELVSAWCMLVPSQLACYCERRREGILFMNVLVRAVLLSHGS